MADVAGNWQLVMESPMGRREPKLELKVDGDQLSGTWTGQMGANPISGGSVDGDNISFTMEMAAMGQSISMNFKAKIEGDKLTGEVVSPRGTMPITGTRIAG